MKTEEALGKTKGDKPRNFESPDIAEEIGLSGTHKLIGLGILFGHLHSKNGT